MPEAELHLHRVDRGDASGLFDLSDVDVAEADRFDQTVSLQRGERADAGGERCPRVGRMELVEREAIHAERLAARLACRGKMSRASVREPPSIRARQTAFGRDGNARAIAGPCRQRTSDEAFVVTGFGRVPAVGVRGIEEIHARVERGVQRGNGSRLVPIWIGREAHASDADERRLRLPHASRLPRLIQD